MNRRDFLGAFLSGLVAALVLPFDDFVRWWKGISESPRRVETLLNMADVVNFEAGETYSWNSGSSMGTLVVTHIDRSAGIITVSA